MANDFVSQQLAAIAAKKAASQAAQAAPAPVTPPPAAEPSPATPPAETQTVVTSLATPGTPPAKPAEVSQADWDALPPDVRALVALGPAGQAVPVNPPEAAQGIVESATGKPAEEGAKRGRGRPKGSHSDLARTAEPEEPEASIVAAQPIDLAPILAGLDAQGTGVRAELKAIREAIEANTAATTALVEAVLGAASILAG